MKKWTVDTAHSEVGFSVKHMMISKVKGAFTSYEATVEANEEDLQGALIDFKIDVASIDTSNTDRDNHLRSADFFDVEQFPYITFKANDIIKKGDEYELTGDLTMKDVTRPVTFEVEYGGKATNPWGVEVVAFNVEGKVNRRDFGLTWNQALETGGVLVGEDIKITLELEGNPA
ncbi:YceI family protein [Microbacterium sp. APC 3898]|uniref:YceI family protein n=2 Tax=Planococcus TaxID=1372 RepID=A0ABT7ZM86_9BACL|nr:MULTISPECIES: YceI family protein [Terrabacteria group]MBF6632577.1 polyisoprenoid-binding protein [Planococcus sp. (in: firmicutes)]MBD8015339.1 polyisoprenoid-binding protein [Planococcus wigleyi]MDN3428228.1 YceI family protein [Planococcus sp. APC 4016]MDN3439455.1 YceI family protein [Planococcus sp. APC 3900]MDN3498234.1 YceI family protein [Microbacterium sp. APC 3898]